jgi:hypothetical protein
LIICSPESDDHSESQCAADRAAVSYRKSFDSISYGSGIRRRAVTLSKLAKFQRLRGVPVSDDAGLLARFGSINSEKIAQMS